MKKNTKYLIENELLMKEWDWDKNKNINPNSVVYSNSSIKFWWKCKKEHGWLSTVRNRIRWNTECPCCTGKKASGKKGPEDNCLGTKCPELSSEWNYKKNINLTPYDVLPGSSKKPWWTCSKGHEWQAKIADRVSKKTKCPYCVNRKVSVDNCLAAKYPELAKQWHPTKNGKLTPWGVVPGSKEKVWWVCTKNKGHEWQAVVKTRAILKCNCPCCVNLKVSEDNCLAVTHPELAKEWDYKSNYPMSPLMFVAGRKEKFWWICKNNNKHKWQATIVSRTHMKSDCPYCSDNKVCNDNCLATVRPDLCKEWDNKSNYPLTPKEIVWGCHQKVWWQCLNGHKWKASIKQRTAKHGTNCPFCNKVELKNGKIFDSMLDAWYYLLFKKNNIKVKYNKKYNTLKRFRFDFYIPEINTYIELTSFSKKINYGKDHYAKYMKTIESKKNIVLQKGANFEFIQRILSYEERSYLDKFIKRPKL